MLLVVYGAEYGFWGLTSFSGIPVLIIREIILDIIMDDDDDWEGYKCTNIFVAVGALQYMGALQQVIVRNQ